MQDDPFHKNRTDEQNVKRREAEKKREYAAMLQEQMAMKKKSQEVNLPPPDQLFNAPLS